MRYQEQYKQVVRNKFYHGFCPLTVDACVVSGVWMCLGRVYVLFARRNTSERMGARSDGIFGKSNMFPLGLDGTFKIRICLCVGQDGMLLQSQDTLVLYKFL